MILSAGGSNNRIGSSLMTHCGCSSTGNGRIVQTQWLYGPAFNWLTVAVKLETIEVNGVPQTFSARLESAVKRRKDFTITPMPPDLGSFDQMHDPDD